MRSENIHKSISGDTMLDFVINFISNNTATLVSLLALGISVKSYSISHRTIKLTEKITGDAKKLKAFEQRAEILEIHDKKNAKISTLQLIYAEQLSVLTSNLYLPKKYPKELERIKNNIECNQKASSPEIRKFLEALDDSADIADNTKILADAKRFLIAIEEEIVKENRWLNTLKEELK